MNATLNKRFHAALTANGLMEQKSNFISDATKGRTSSSKDLSDHEALTLIVLLEGQNRKATPKTEPKNDELKTQVKSVCYWFYQIGFVNDKGKLDGMLITKFCTAKTAAKKRLDKMNKAELTALVTIKNYLSKISA